MTLLKKKRERNFEKELSLSVCLWKRRSKIRKLFQNDGKNIIIITKNPVVVVTTSTRAFFFCDDRETPAPPTARQNGLRNFIRRVCDEILAEVVLEEQLQSSIYEQIVHQNQRVQDKINRSSCARLTRRGRPRSWTRTRRPQSSVGPLVVC